MNDTKGDVGEQLVYDIIEKAIPDIFCYPSPKDLYGDKKEICDLIIIIDEILILISVKNYEFKGIYSRYFNNTIAKAINQLYGAERKLFGNKEIFLEHPKLGVKKFRKAKIKKIFSIIVNLGEGVKYYPFNKSTSNGRFVSIFDKLTFQNLIKELDTISDLIKYLEDREEVFKNSDTIILPLDEYDFDENDSIQFSNHSIDGIKKPQNSIPILISGNELDLLALYLKNNRSFPDVFKEKKYDYFCWVCDGDWDNYLRQREVIAKKVFDKKSYFIDDFIKKELLPTYKDDAEDCVIFLSLLNRFERRYISKPFLEIIFSPQNKEFKKRKLFILRRHIIIGNRGFVFAIYSDDWKHEMLVDTLRIALESFCIYSKFEAKDYILIGNTFSLKEFHIRFMKNIIPFDKDYEEMILSAAKEIGFLTDMKEFKLHEDEYPDLKRVSILTRLKKIVKRFY